MGLDLERKWQCEILFSSLDWALQEEIQGDLGWSPPAALGSRISVPWPETEVRPRQ